jgi:hypothetical protein
VIASFINPQSHPFQLLCTSGIEKKQIPIFDTFLLFQALHDPYRIAVIVCT